MRLKLNRNAGSWRPVGRLPRLGRTRAEGMQDERDSLTAALSTLRAAVLLPGRQAAPRS